MSRLSRFVVVALCFTALMLCVDSTSAAAFKRVHAGDQAPSFTLPDLDGNPVSLEDHKDGPLTIVTFWALWSPKSEPLLQDIQRILDEFAGNGLRVKAIAVNEDGGNTPADFIDQVKGLVERNGLKFPVVVDSGMEEYATWGVIATPSTAFLGKDLKVEFEFSGRPSSAYEDMRDQVMKILGIEEEVVAAAKPKRERYQTERRVLLNYGMAKTIFERGQFSKAKRKLKKVLAEDPGFPDAHALQGLIHLGLAGSGKAGADDRAREAFSTAVELDPTVPTGLVGLAHFALVDDDVAKALELSVEAVKYTEDEVLAKLASSPIGTEEETETPTEDGSPAAQEPDETTQNTTDAPTEEAPATATAVEPTDGGDETAVASEAADEMTIGDTRLQKAAALLAQGDAENAEALVAEFVDRYLAIPEAPHMSEKGMKMQMMMRQQQMQQQKQPAQ